jgi:hypothetical protein
MPTPVGPNQPNRAFGTTPYAEQPAEAAWQRVETVDAAPDSEVVSEVQTAPISLTAITEPPAPAGGSNTTRTDRQSPTEDIAAATADPTGET